jgi:hypothetical protein
MLEQVIYTSLSVGVCITSLWGKEVKLETIGCILSFVDLREYSDIIAVDHSPNSDICNLYSSGCTAPLYIDLFPRLSRVIPTSAAALMYSLGNCIVQIYTDAFFSSFVLLSCVKELDGGSIWLPNSQHVITPLCFHICIPLSDITKPWRSASISVKVELQ